MSLRGLAIPMLAAWVSLAGADTPPRPRMPDPSTMSPYVLGIYTRGPEWSAERTPRTDSIQAGHLEHIRRMHEAGALIGAGPLSGNPKIRGLLLFRDLPMDSIRNLVVKDPALKTSRLLLELHRWYAPRGLGVAYEARASLRPDHPDSMITLPVAFLWRPAHFVPVDSALVAQAGPGHTGHILDLLISGKLLAAGPFFDDQPLRGIGVFGTDSSTARKLALDDPAVRAGRLAVEMLSWSVAWGVMPTHPVVKEAVR
jgi:hypothetical protein